MKICLLSEIENKGTFQIIKVKANGEIRRRLVDIGFIKNGKGQVLREALLRDPIEIKINNTNVSLRRSEARLIEVKVIE